MINGFMRFADEIKLWLKARGKTYAWLANNIFVSPSTMNGWLSYNKEISTLKIAHIKKFMEDYDKENKPPETDNILILPFDSSNFDLLNQAASADKKLIREWAINVLLKEAKSRLKIIK